MNKNLFLGKALEDIGSEGEVEIVGGTKVKVKNILEQDITKEQNIVIVQCDKTKRYYIYAAGI
jgi:hypothetical protein